MNPAGQWDSNFRELSFLPDEIACNLWAFYKLASNFTESSPQSKTNSKPTH